MSLADDLDEMFEDAQSNEDMDIDEENATGGGEAFNTPKAFKKKTKRKTESSFMALSKEMHLGEATYRDYKRDDTSSQQQKVNRSIKEINSKLFYIEQIVNQNSKLKQEAGVDSNTYWKSTKANLSKVSEKMLRISEKLRRF